ncbi:MAG: serine hydrolase domain-containing protein [Deltaproteobacteria bacterium]|nr:serine hydrolase domain-containing protein [Myxococcales bacterium]MDP3215357.1 serine hydrolase domain-containing protein [Deltaproteobacteria bacterium]
MRDAPTPDHFERALRPVLLDAIAGGATPGAQLALSLRSAPVLHLAVGTLDGAPGRPVRDDTVYDLASLTKPLTALAAVRLAAAGALSLDEPIGALWPGRFGEATAALRLDALLSHRAGLPAWIGAYEDVDLADCGTAAARQRVIDRLGASIPSPGGAAVYSDVGYILAGEAIAARAGEGIDALVRREVITPLGLDALHARGVGARWRDPGVAPTERCPWRGRVVQGEVHDENAYALGGVAGHAGVFGTAVAVAALGRACLDGLRDGGTWLSRASLAAMTAARPGGTHRLGWDGVSPAGSSAGRYFGASAFGHLGFTGTSLWCDPALDVAVALVTNRVHPSRDAVGIRALRPRVHDAIIELLRRNE